MENASKALIIAGGVLIAVMLAALVMYTFTKWGDNDRAKEADVEAQRISEFNKSYLSYEKVLYGSELLGLVNKMNDYNKSLGKTSSTSGYDKMNISLETNGGNDDLFKKGTYNLDSITNTVNNVLKDTKGRYSNISDAVWEKLAKASSSDNSFNGICEQYQLDANQLREPAKKYYTYIQFKRLKFKHTGTTFAKSGRVGSMSYRQTN